MPLSPAGEKTVAAKPLDAKPVVAQSPVAASATPATAAPAKPPVVPASTQTIPAGVGSTRVATWQDDKKAVFLLMFDDGWPSHWQVALPELKKRDMIGTFYIVPSKGEYTKFEKTWLTDMLGAGMVFANHTMTHNGFQGKADTEMEIDDATQYLLKKVPGKNPRLISFGLPGVKDYDYGGLDFNALLAQNHLINRPDFRDHGANYHIKTIDQYIALADKAIAAGGMEYIVFHGLERITPNWGYQDMWAVKQDIFLPFLDALQERRDRGDLWITDHISWHQYKTEREAAQVAVAENTARRIVLKLSTTADAAFYDLPLTLVTQVPAAWKKCQITQGAKTQIIEVAQGSARFQAQPDGTPITLQPA
jgi:peptidoglycan/xylan/chitin deacetylase (PgdA/CDA1 family)